MNTEATMQIVIANLARAAAYLDQHAAGHMEPARVDDARAVLNDLRVKWPAAACRALAIDGLHDMAIAALVEIADQIGAGRKPDVNSLKCRLARYHGI